MEGTGKLRARELEHHHRNPMQQHQWGCSTALPIGREWPLFASCLVAPKHLSQLALPALSDTHAKYEAACSVEV